MSDISVYKPDHVKLCRILLSLRNNGMWSCHTKSVQKPIDPVPSSLLSVLAEGIGVASRDEGRLIHELTILGFIEAIHATSSVEDEVYCPFPKYPVNVWRYSGARGDMFIEVKRLEMLNIWPTWIEYKKQGDDRGCAGGCCYSLTDMGIRAALSAEITDPRATVGGGNGDKAGDGDTLNGYVSADTLLYRHGIKQPRVSEAAKEGKVRTKRAPSGMINSSGKAVRILYHEADATRYCAPKHVKEKTRRITGLR